MVEAVRTGTIIARNPKAANAWATRKAQAGPGGKPLTPAAFDQQIQLMAKKMPNRIRTERAN